MLKILLTGRTGQIGRELVHALAPLGVVVAPTRAEFDLARPDTMRSVLRQARPQVIVNAAAFTSMDRSEAQPDLAMRLNAMAPSLIAEEAKELDALMVHYSSAYVFDGLAGRPYVEDDPVGPINAYGRTKLAGERAIAATGARHIILRLSWIHSLGGNNFLTALLRLAREKDALPVVNDQIGSPTWARTVAHATARVLGRGPTAELAAGTFHLSAAGMVSRYGFAEEIIATARRMNGGRDALASPRPVASEDYPVPAARPKYCVLDNSRIRRAYGIGMPDWEWEVHSCMAEITPGASAG